MLTKSFLKTGGEPSKFECSELYIFHSVVSSLYLLFLPFRLDNFEGPCISITISFIFKKSQYVTRFFCEACSLVCLDYLWSLLSALTISHRDRTCSLALPFPLKPTYTQTWALEMHCCWEILT